MWDERSKTHRETENMKMTIDTQSRSGVAEDKSRTGSTGRKELKEVMHMFITFTVVSDDFTDVYTWPKTSEITHFVCNVLYDK